MELSFPFTICNWVVVLGGEKVAVSTTRERTQRVIWVDLT